MASSVTAASLLSACVAYAVTRVSSSFASVSFIVLVWSSSSFCNSARIAFTSAFFARKPAASASLPTSIILRYASFTSSDFFCNSAARAATVIS